MSGTTTHSKTSLWLALRKLCIHSAVLVALLLSVFLNRFHLSRSQYEQRFGTRVSRKDIIDGDVCYLKVASYKTNVVFHLPSILFSVPPHFLFGLYI